MKLEYIGLSEMEGSLIYLDGVSGIGYDEMAEISLENGEKRYGRVIMLDGSRAVLQVFEGTKGISLENARTNFTGPWSWPCLPRCWAESLTVPAGPLTGWASCILRSVGI